MLWSINALWEFNEKHVVAGGILKALLAAQFLLKFICTKISHIIQFRPGAKYIEKYSNTLQLHSLTNDYNYITITGLLEM